MKPDSLVNTESYSLLFEEIDKGINLIKRKFDEEIQRKWNVIQDLRDQFQYPEAMGHLKEELIKCGKSNCRCYRGALHGPYWYLYKINTFGRLSKTYICSSKRPNNRLVELRMGIKTRKRNHSLQKTINLFQEEINTLEKRRDSEVTSIGETFLRNLTRKKISLNH